jgi:hypothetical protein
VGMVGLDADADARAGHAWTCRSHTA